MKERVLRMAVLGLLLMATQTFVFGQTTGSVSGTVTDPNGAVVAGANITVKNNGTGVERSSVTKEDGVFNVTTLPPGMYTVTVEAAGFKRTVAPDIAVEVTKQSQVSIALPVGLSGETVTVTAGQDVINSVSPSLTNVINTRQVVDLPLGGRNPLDLAALQAGIAVIGTNVRGASVGGLRQTAVNVSQDGINAMDNFVKTSSFFAISTPSLNSTAEFSITTGTVGSDAGRGAAQVNLVTKGGSNDFHGGAFLQLVNEWANANTYFNNFNGTVKPKLRQHFYGFDIGGPVHFLGFGEGVPAHWDGKDKAFFFFSFERFAQIQAASRNRSGVLTESARNGMFSYNRTCPTNPINPACTPGVQTVNLITLSSRGLPINPLMTTHLAQIPLPNNFNCGASDGFNVGCYSFNVPENTTNNKYVGRYDHQLIKDSRFGGHKLEFVYSRVDTKTLPDVFTNGVEAPFPGGVNAYQFSTRNLITPALVSTYGSSVTNVLRYGRQWAPVVFDRDSPPTAPFISLPGVLVNYDNLNMAQPRETIVNQWTDTLSWVSGNHLLKFGVDYQKVLTKSFNSAGINQTIQLGGTNGVNNAGFVQANLPFASNTNLTGAVTTYAAITGLLSTSSQTLNVTSLTSGFVPGALRFRDFQAQDVALFAQDQWRLRNNFTLSYGLRWEFLGVPTVPSGLAIQPRYEDVFGISGFGNLFNPTAPAGPPPGIATQQFVSGDTGKRLYNDDWNNFAPFLGFAYSPNFKSGPLHFLFGDEGQSSIRAGYSISYLRDGLTTISNALGVGTTNPGLIQTANISSTTLSSNLTGVLTAAGVPLVTPSFIMPITDRQNILSNVNNGIWAFDPNLVTPYVQQWNVGFEREIFKGTALEVRYQGNRALKVWRAVDYNEVNIFENGFLQEFLNAQRNLSARNGTGFAPNSTASPCAACVPLPIFDRFFGLTPGGTAVAAGSAYGSAAFIGNLNTNQAGALASTLAFNTAYRTNREKLEVGIPANFFVANPNAAFARVLSNDANSNYHALEIEVRRRFANGLQFQADYTWSKALGNAVDAQGNNQSDLVSWRTLRDKKLDYRRSTQDQTMRFVANAVYDLPFGNGRTFLSGSNGFVDRIVGGWTIGSIVTWATGVPFFVSSGRATFNSFNAANNPAQLVGISFEEFKKNVGLFKTPGGVLYINPELLDITYNSAGKIATSRLKAGLMGSPAPGTFGNFPLNSLNGPRYFNFDMSVTKRIPITETVRFEIKLTAINILNHPNFTYGAQNFDSTTFGLITGQTGNSRNMNIIGALRF